MPEEFPKPTENRWEKTEPGELPLPPEHPREEVYRALSVGGGILCLLLTASIIVFLFYYANIEEQAAKESQKTAEAMRDNAERLIASLTEDLRQQQGKPVDAKFADRISSDVSNYYGNSTDKGSSTQSGRNQGKLLSDVASFAEASNFRLNNIHHRGQSLGVRGPKPRGQPSGQPLTYDFVCHERL